MALRIICPHCHAAIDPLTLEAAFSAQAHYRICPECDTAIVVLSSRQGDDTQAPRADLRVELA